MQIFITGADGQAGRALQRALEAHHVVALAHGQLDVTDGAAVDAAIGERGPDWVVHAAALTDTTLCEREPDRADAVNGEGAGNVARACERASARLIAISTNEVFDGTQRRPYVENDVRNPINAYGRSKLLGERAVHDALGGNEIVVRTSWVYGDGASNYVEKVRAAARAGGVLRFATDEVASPTSAADLARGIGQLIASDAAGGAYHLTNGGETSRYEWAVAILQLAGISAEIEPVTTSELRAGGYRGPRKPAYSSLANTRAAAIGVTLRPWGEALSAHFERAAVRG